MLRFLRADRITDVESAERILSKYHNREVEMKLDFNTFRVNLLGADAQDGIFYVKFTWRPESKDISDFEHLYQYAKSKQGSFVRFQVGTDELHGVLSALTEFPEGSTMERYVDSPFVLGFAFTAEDQHPSIGGSLVTAGGKGSIIGMYVPENVSAHLGCDPDLEYDPHITVAYFPKLELGDIPNVLRCAQKAAALTGPISAFTDGSETFPTPQDDGRYPLVARVNSPELHQFHEKFVSLMEHFAPGSVDLTFTHKNYNPHVTLKYVSEPGVSVPVKRLAWTTDELYLSFKGGEEFFPIPLRADVRTGGREESAVLQVGDTPIPVLVLSDEEGQLVVRLKRSTQAPLVDQLDDDAVKLVTPVSEARLIIVQSLQEGTDRFRLTYRTQISRTSAARLRYVAAVARDRGISNVVSRISSLLDFSEVEEESEEDDAEDKEALGPGFPGTDPRIVEYVRAPQTQQIVEEPKFTRKLPLHERI